MKSRDLNFEERKCIIGDRRYTMYYHQARKKKNPISAVYTPHESRVSLGLYYTPCHFQRLKELLALFETLHYGLSLLIELLNMYNSLFFFFVSANERFISEHVVPEFLKNHFAVVVGLGTLYEYYVKDTHTHTPSFE